mgnify:CR=1 FL=1
MPRLDMLMQLAKALRRGSEELVGASIRLSLLLM